MSYGGAAYGEVPYGGESNALSSGDITAPAMVITLVPVVAGVAGTGSATLTAPAVAMPLVIVVAAVAEQTVVAPAVALVISAVAATVTATGSAPIAAPVLAIFFAPVVPGDLSAAPGGVFGAAVAITLTPVVATVTVGTYTYQLFSEVIGETFDALGVFLSGGAGNKDSTLCLGGVASSSRLRGMGGIISTPIPSIRIDNIYPACREGTATLAIDANGDLVFTPPGDLAGTPVTIAAGESKIVAGFNGNKAIRVFREAGLDYAPGMSSSLELAYAMNGLMSMENITNAQRVAGVVTYRALFLQSQGTGSVGAIRLWTPPQSAVQASYELAYETPAGATIQTVANELTAPTAVSFVVATKAAPLVIPGVLTATDYMGVWLKKTFPVGLIDAQEEFQLAMKFVS